MSSRSAYEGIIAALHEWARGYDPKLRLNAVLAKAGDRSLVTSASSKVAEYIGGAADRRLGFSLCLIEPWSEGADGLNARAMAEGESWLAWAAEQFPENVPAIPGAEVIAIDPDDEVPVLVQVTQDGRLARYQFNVHMDYRS